MQARVPTPAFVAYYRVSTDRQGRSGLGLDAQRDAVARHAAATGGIVSAAFEEIESGRRGDRPQLAAALVESRTRRATLLVAKLDRLTRDAHFLLGLEKAGVEFVAADMPHAIRGYHVATAPGAGERDTPQLLPVMTVTSSLQHGTRL